MTGGPVLAADGIRRRFAGVTAVDDFSLSLPQGEIHGLIGPNGAGKTTVFNLLTGLLRPSAGRISLLGRDVSRWSADRRARAGLGRVFQRTQLFATLNVAEHLALVDPAGRGQTWLEALGLQGFRSALPAELPHGIARKVELAAVLATGSPVLLLDEPAAGLTEEERQDLALLLRAAREQGRTLLVVEHDLEWTLSLVDRLTVLEGGRTIASGDPGAVARDARVRVAYLGEEGAPS